MNDLQSDTPPAADDAARVSLTPRAAEIAREARLLLEDQGSDALSMRNIAARIGIRAASLYEHFADKRAVENAIMAAGLYDQGDHVAAAVEAHSGDDGSTRIDAIGAAFREWALAHPHLYMLIMSRDLDHSAPDVAEAEEYAGRPIRAEVGEHREISLSLWAFSHGLVSLEINQRLPGGFEPDALWATGLRSLEAELQARRSAA